MPCIKRLKRYRHGLAAWRPSAPPWPRRCPGTPPLALRDLTRDESAILEAYAFTNLAEVDAADPKPPRQNVRCRGLLVLPGPTPLLCPCGDCQNTESPAFGGNQECRHGHRLSTYAIRPVVLVLVFSGCGDGSRGLRASVRAFPRPPVIPWIAALPRRFRCRSIIAFPHALGHCMQRGREPLSGTTACRSSLSEAVMTTAGPDPCTEPDPSMGGLGGRWQYPKVLGGGMGASLPIRNRVPHAVGNCMQRSRQRPCGTVSSLGAALTTTAGGSTHRAGSLDGEGLTDVSSTRRFSVVVDVVVTIAAAYRGGKSGGGPKHGNVTGTARLAEWPVGLSRSLSVPRARWCVR